jgi:uncharacterized protein YqjF (DUF2071 family)
MLGESMLRKILIAEGAIAFMLISICASAQQPAPDPVRLTAIIQQMKAEKDNATDQVAVLSADLALANAKIDKLTKDLAAAQSLAPVDPKKH